MKYVITTVTMWTKEGYRLDILKADQVQILMTVGIVRETIDGYRIDPKEFPEAAYFTVRVQEVGS